jgi:SAM-dependent methyltransferase
MLLTLRLPELPAGSVARPPGTAVRTVELPGGRAHLFHPHPDELAVMVEADPAGRPFPERGARPRMELLAAAAGGLLPTALGGDDGEPHAVEVRFPALASPEGEAAFTRLFAPLGYTIEATLLPLDRLRPWAPGSWYFSLVLRGRHRVEDVASHLGVLLRLLDTGGEPHDAAAGAARWDAARHWLESHPKRQMLERRIVLGGFGMDRHGPRHETVVAALKESGARRVLDLGCGTGALLRRLLEEPQFTEVVGVEVGQRALAEAEAALPAGGRARVLHGSLVYRDARLAGFDAAAVVEVVEHLDPPQLAAFEDALWAAARPGTIVLTTPNADYNTLFEYHRGGALRHADHRFEWTRAEFQAWAHAVAARHGYAVRFGAVGVETPGVGALTQVAVFTRLPGPPPAPADAAAPASAGWPCLEDVAGRRTVSTRLGAVHVTADESAAALEPISRFAVDPRWLVYLPATTPAAETQAGTGAREHPSAALAYYRARGVERVALQELHAGTRVAVVVCRDAGAARNRFGAAAGETGAVYTAVGRRWFATRQAEEEFLARVRGALDAGGLWRELGTEWVALEGVMGPGSPLMREVDPGDRPVIALYWGAAAVELATLAAEEEVLARPAAEDANAAALLARVRARAAAVCVYEDAVRRLCVPAYAPGDLRLAHVRVLAGEGAVYAARDPGWHLDRLAAPAAAAPHTLLETEQAVIDLADPASEETAQAWWEAAVARGGRGVVVRPLEAATDGLMAPAVKCRGDAALLLAHGPEHALPGHREQARGPGLDEACSRAAREWALSLEALEGFVHGEPAARVHACFFAALGVKLGGRP